MERTTMRLWVKVGLFLSAYLPLFFILTIKNWFNLPTFVLFVVISVYSLIWWWLIVRIARQTTKEEYRVTAATNKMKESLTYLLPYIIGFLPLNVNIWQDWAALVVLLVIVFMVYVNSDLLYVNPLLLFFSYNIYELEVYKPSMGEETSTQMITLITRRKKVPRNMTLSLHKVDKATYLEE
ncbi:hypothetical protein [Methanoculleus sp. UBA291]|jgi:hypothetical protein|uniref:hypothetical protein n=1 Tax=Methanoculleus sp. UBA291 TaxID=1915495 RepID=UPI00316ACCE4